MTATDEQQRWHGDWTPQGRVKPRGADGDRRYHARSLTRVLLAHGDDPSRVLFVVTDTFGEVGREEALAVIERTKATR